MFVPRPQYRATPSDDDLAKRLCLCESELIKDIYDTAQRITVWEDERKKAIEGKAAGLVTASGICVSIVAAFVAASTRAPVEMTASVVAITIATLAAGTLAALFAVFALRVRADLRRIDECDFLRPDVLERADSGMEDGVSAWRRYMIVHHMRVAQENDNVNTQKALHLSRSQLAMTGLILGAFLLGTMLVSGAYNDRSQQAQTKAKACADAAAIKRTFVYRNL